MSHPVGKMIAQGNTAEIFDYGNHSILKLYRDGLPKSLCHDEFEKTQVAYQLIKNVPKPVDTISFDERVGAIYEKLSGKTMLKKLLSSPWRVAQYAKALARYHINIQKPVAVEFPTVKEKLKADIDRVDLLSDTEKHCIYRNLDALPNGDTLCHFDYHPDNIILHDIGYSIIDWMTACKGDKLSDVARTGIILKFSRIPRVPAIINLLVGRFQRNVYKNYINEYLNLTQENMHNIEKWEPVVAAARLSEWIPTEEKEMLLAFVRKSMASTLK